MSTVVVCRSQAIFEAYVAPDGLPPVKADWIEHMTVSDAGPGTLFLSTYLGRGPFSHTLQASAEFFFEQGENPYPVFEVPGAGPRGASLLSQKTEQKLQVGENKAIFIVSVTVMKNVALASWQDALDNRLDAGLQAGISAMLSETKVALDSAVGSYALYQFPLVWRQVAEQDSYGFVDFANSRSTRAIWSRPIDSFVAFRLNASSQVVGPHQAFMDPLHKQVAALVGAKLVEPFIFLKDSLWHTDIRARFLLQFWIVEYFSEKRTADLPRDEVSRSLVAKLEGLVKDHLAAEDLERFKNKKGELLRRTLAEKVAYCCDALRIHYDDAEFKRAKKVRDNLSHGSAYTLQELNESELYVRSLCRYVLRRELESRGIFLDGEPRPLSELPILTVPSFRADRPDMQTAQIQIP